MEGTQFDRLNLARALLIGLAMLVAPVVAGGVRPAAAKSVEWANFDVTLDLQQDGSYHVVERQTVDFTGGPWHGGFRDVPLARIDHVDAVAVGELVNGRTERYQFVSPDAFNDQAGTYTYSISNATLAIQWGLGSISDQTRVFLVAYDVSGVLRTYPNATPPYQQISWIAVDRALSQTAPVRNASLTINLPVAVNPAQTQVQPPDDPKRHTTDGKTWRWTASNLSGDASFAVGLRFPPIVDVAPPSWQSSSDQAEQQTADATRTAIEQALAASPTATPDHPLATPGATPVAASTPLLDLAWMTVAPADLAEPGYGVVSGTAGYRDLGGFSQFLFGSGPAQAQFSTAAANAGYRQGYVNLVAQPSDETPELFRRVVRTTLAQFRSAAGAASAYATLLDFRERGGLTRLQTPPAVGDQSVALRDAGTAPSGRHYERLYVIVQTGDVLASIAVDDYDNNAPLLSQSVALATEVADRIAAGRAGRAPGLSLALPRLAGDGLTVNVDRYRRRAGVEAPYYDQSASALTSLANAHASDGIADQYWFDAQWSASASPDADNFEYSIFINQFADEQAAHAYFAANARSYLRNPPTEIHDVSEVSLPVGGADETVTLAFAYDPPSGKTTHHFTTWLRIGDRVASVGGGGVPGVAFDWYGDLIQRVPECLRQAPCGGTVAVTVAVATPDHPLATPTPQRYGPMSWLVPGDLLDGLGSGAPWAGDAAGCRH